MLLALNFTGMIVVFLATPAIRPQIFDVTAVPCPKGSSLALLAPGTMTHSLFGTNVQPDWNSYR